MDACTLLLTEAGNEGLNKSSGGNVWLAWVKNLCHVTMNTALRVPRLKPLQTVVQNSLLPTLSNET